MSTRILVVDDEAVVRGEILEALRVEGHAVTEAATAEQALEMFRAAPFPLVITDIYAGTMTGIDLLREIKSLRPESLVVLMTGDASLEAAMQALRHGAYDLLIKPFDGHGVITAVARRAAEWIALDDHNRALRERERRHAEELERLNARLTDMANRDGLTGLYNHRYFREALDQELARAKRHQRTFSLLFADIDHFKQFNDTHGHLAGDELLRRTAKLLTQRCRVSTIAARYGGDEFVMLAPETDAEGGRQFGESLRRLVESYAFRGGETQPLGRITLSIGVASYPDAGEDCTTLIQHADRALYESKGRGRNLVSVWAPTVAC